ncbi:hypothetical protein L218DRAFT_588518 [Marasmius fiardii PR-910]|nr:hypothetical protein L218DRAFT_588518 [Marasmius fiardii PR-910]
MLKSANPPWFGDSGLIKKWTINTLITSGLEDKLLKRRIISLIGVWYLFSIDFGNLEVRDFSLGERFGLRIIPSSNSFLVLPNNISWSTAVGSVLLGLHGGGNEWDIVVALSGDERLLRRLGELDNSETISTSGKGSTDAKWRLVRDVRPGEQSDVGKVLREFAEC